MTVLEKTKELEWNLFSFSAEAETNQIEEVTVKQEIQSKKITEPTEEVCKNDESDDNEEETFDASAVGKQPYECGAVVRFVSKKGKKEEILTGIVYGHGWNAGSPDIKGPADNILIRTDDKKSHVTPKRFVLEIITPAPTAA